MPGRSGTIPATPTGVSARRPLHDIMDEDSDRCDTTKNNEATDPLRYLSDSPRCQRPVESDCSSSCTDLEVRASDVELARADEFRQQHRMEQRGLGLTRRSWGSGTTSISSETTMGVGSEIPREACVSFPQSEHDMKMAKNSGTGSIESQVLTPPATKASTVMAPMTTPKLLETPSFRAAKAAATAAACLEASGVPSENIPEMFPVAVLQRQLQEQHLGNKEEQAEGEEDDCDGEEMELSRPPWLEEEEGDGGLGLGLRLGAEAMSSPPPRMAEGARASPNLWSPRCVVSRIHVLRLPHRLVSYIHLRSFHLYAVSNGPQPLKTCC